MSSEAGGGGDEDGSTQRMRAHWPKQARGRRRYEEILDAADRLLQRIEPADFTIQAVSEEAGISGATVYQYFRSPGRVLTALSHRYFAESPGRSGERLSAEICTFEQFDAIVYERARQFLHARPAMGKLLFGTSPVADLSPRDPQDNVLLVEKALANLEKVFVLPSGLDLVQRLLEVLIISNALWALSFQRHGRITDEMAERARLARVAYIRTFLPDGLELRSSSEPESGPGPDR
jgi:AcrR family transcriptional regulator